MKKINIHVCLEVATLLLLTLFISLAASCSDKEVDNIAFDAEEEESEEIAPTPTADVVKNKFTGKVAMLQANNDDENLEYINKRLTNNSTILTDDASVIIIDEVGAANAIGDENFYSVLNDAWSNGKMFLFLSPGENALKLTNKLKGQTSDETVITPSSEEVNYTKMLAVLGERADGTSLEYVKVKNSLKEEAEEIYDVTDDGELVKDEVASAQQSGNSDSHTITDYDKGTVADNIADWLNEKVTVAPLNPNKLMTRAGSDNFEINRISKTTYFSTWIDHLWIYEQNLIDDNKYRKIPPGATIHMRIDVTVTGTYSETNDCDVYDVTVSEQFPGINKHPAIINRILYKKLAYAYKYTGALYSGPEVEVYLTEKDGIEKYGIKNVSPNGSVPISTSEQYTETHNPMQIGIGGSLMGNIAAQPGLSLGLSANVTLPSTTVSFNRSVMPFEYIDYGYWASWNYTTNLRVYQGKASFNRKFIGVPDMMKTTCKIQQATTFVIRNSRELKDKQLELNCGIGWSMFNEFASPWHHKVNRHIIGKRIFSFNLPKVDRFFGKYTPYPAKDTGMSDQGGWKNLESLLMDNINYRALKQNNIKVGARESEKLDDTAEKIWRNTLESLVEQYGGHNTSSEYIVGLSRADGSHLKLGLHIKDGKWNIVEDLDAIK